MSEKSEPPPHSERGGDGIGGLNAKLMLSGDNRRTTCAACLEQATELMIRRIEVKGGALEIDAKVAESIVVGIAAGALEMLGSAENYVEMSMAVAQLPHETVTLLIQRHGGKTPHEARVEAERKLAIASTRIARLKSDNAALRDSLSLARSEALPSPTHALDLETEHDDAREEVARLTTRNALLESRLSSLHHTIEQLPTIATDEGKALFRTDDYRAISRSAVLSSLIEIL